MKQTNEREVIQDCFEKKNVYVDLLSQISIVWSVLEWNGSFYVNLSLNWFVFCQNQLGAGV